MWPGISGGATSGSATGGTTGITTGGITIGITVKAQPKLESSNNEMGLLSWRPLLPFLITGVMSVVEDHLKGGRSTAGRASAAHSAALSWGRTEDLIGGSAATCIAPGARGLMQIAGSRAFVQVQNDHTVAFGQAALCPRQVLRSCPH